MSADREIEYILRDRRKGKTSRLIEWVLEDPSMSRAGMPRRCILTHTRREADRLKRAYPALADHFWPVAYLPQRRHLTDHSIFAIDNFELIMFSEFRHLDIRLVAGTGSIRETEAGILEWALHATPKEISDRIAVLRQDVEKSLGEEPRLVHPSPMSPIAEPDPLIMLPDGRMMGQEEMMIRGHIAMRTSALPTHGKVEPDPPKPRKRITKKASAPRKSTPRKKTPEES